MSILLKIALVLVLAPQTGQQQRYSVEGAVVSGGGFGNRPITVFLEPLNANPVVEVKASAAGAFKFVDVPAGSYYIRVDHQGFEETAQRVEVPAFRRGVTIVLQTKANTTAPEAEFDPGGKFDVPPFSIPEDAVRDYQTAVDEKKRGKTARAIEGLRRALRIAPNFIEAAFQLGSTLYEAGQLKDAEKVLMRALEAAPAAAKLRLVLADVLVKERKYAEALQQIDTYLEENPDGPGRISAETTRSQLVQAMDGR